VELRGAARLYGDVEAPVMVLEEGVLFEGHCRMAQAPTPAPDGLSSTDPLSLAAGVARDLSVAAKR
jgi:cytoskeletal protein CcmA (bactofilin family)